MSYDLSFDKKGATLLGVCGIVIAALLLAAGFLLGMDHSQRGAQPELPLSANPPSLSAAPDGKSTPPTKTQPLTAVPIPDPKVSREAKVDTTPTPPQETTETSNAAFTLQFGAFNEKANAVALIEELKKDHVTATVFTAQDSTGQTWYTVRSGEFATMPEASTFAASLRSTTHRRVLVRRAQSL